MGKLLERPRYSRLVSFIEANLLLTHEMSRLRKHLTNDLDQNHRRRKPTLAVFLDINNANDSVQSATAIDRLH